MRCGPLRRIWLCAMGHCGGFGSTLWATAADLVMRYGPLHGMKPYSKNVLISALWVIAQDLVMPYGPLRRVWLSAMDRSEGFA
jgi:hypothetical protein